MKAMLIVLTLVACENHLSALPDGAPAALTWRDAETVWADAWCSYAQRCYPPQFSGIYGTHEYCVESVVNDNCRSACPYLYPYERYEVLDQCYQQMFDLACEASSVPLVCIEAFR